jgi:hypothetical protein
MSTRPPKPSPYHYWSRDDNRWVTQYELEGRSIKYMNKHAPDFYDIEGGRDLQSTQKMKSALGDSTTMSLNAVQVRSGRPMTTGGTRGSEWEQLISVQDHNVDIRESGTGRYVHIAQLIAAQEYELCRLGKDRRASSMRTAWALHSQGLSERYIARELGRSRHEIRKYLIQLHAIVLQAVDAEVDAMLN